MAECVAAVFSTTAQHRHAGAPSARSRLELSRFVTPPIIEDHRNAPVHVLGYLRVMFAVDNLDDRLTRLRKLGAQLVGEVVKYEDVYRLCYIRGPEGLLIGLAGNLPRLRPTWGMTRRRGDQHGMHLLCTDEKAGARPACRTHRRVVGGIGIEPMTPTMSR